MSRLLSRILSAESIYQEMSLLDAVVNLRPSACHQSQNLQTLLKGGNCNLIKGKARSDQSKFHLHIQHLKLICVAIFSHRDYICIWFLHGLLPLNLQLYKRIDAGWMSFTMHTTVYH